MPAAAGATDHAVGDTPVQGQEEQHQDGGGEATASATVTGGPDEADPPSDPWLEYYRSCAGGAIPHGPATAAGEEQLSGTTRNGPSRLTGASRAETKPVETKPLHTALAALGSSLVTRTREPPRAAACQTASYVASTRPILISPRLCRMGAGLAPTVQSRTAAPAADHVRVRGPEPWEWGNGPDLGKAFQASPTGIDYYLEWVETRLMDVEVTKIARAKREGLQRGLCENGAATPRGEVPLATAQGLVVRGQVSPLLSELALMASVGNECLQQAALIQDKAFTRSAVPGGARTDARPGWRSKAHGAHD